MNKYHFCIDCEYIKVRMVTGHLVAAVQELSCPARSTRWKGSGCWQKGRIRTNVHGMKISCRFSNRLANAGSVENTCVKVPVGMGCQKSSDIIAKKCHPTIQHIDKRAGSAFMPCGWLCPDSRLFINE